jgi:hypothetical protein
MSEIEELETLEAPTQEPTEEQPKSPRPYKPRPPKTKAQMEAWTKALATRAANAEKRKKEAAELTKAAQKELEKSVVAKALAIKKRQIMAKAKLDELSDDDTPIEKVREVAAKTVAKTVTKPVAKPPAKGFIFV